MTRQDLAYRITKICGRAVSVAVCAMTGMMFMGSAQADVFLGASFFPNGALSSSQVNIYGAPNDGTTRSGATWNPGDNWTEFATTPSYSVSQSRAGDLFYGNQVFQSREQGVLTALYGSYQTGDGWISYENNSSPWWSAEASRNSTFLANTFGAIVDATSANNYIFGAGAGVSSVDRGGKAYTTIHTWEYTLDGGFNFSYLYGAAAAQNSSGNAIQITGNASFSGNNEIDGGLVANSVTVAGSNVNFNGNVDVHNGGLLFSSAGSANLNGGADLTGSVNFQGNNATLTLSNDSDISGNITTTAPNSGIVNFEGSSRITGYVGSALNGTGTLQLLQANGTAGTLVRIDGLAKAETLNLHAGVVALAGGIDTRLQDGSLGSINFGNYDGVVQVNSGLTGNVTTQSNNKGTLTMVENQQSVKGQIGTSSKAIKTLNIGGAGSIGIAKATGEQVAFVTIIGDVFAQGVVFNNYFVDVNSSNSSILKVDPDKNLTTGTSNITTMQDGLGILNLAGGTQTVTGSIGSQGKRLREVNSGMDATVNSGVGSTLFKGNVISVSVSNMQTGTSNFAADVTATYINVNSGISNFTDNVSATTTTIGTGVGNFNTNGTGTTSSTIVFSADRTQIANPNILGSATANLHNGLSGNIDFASKDAVVNVWAGETITGAVVSTGATAKDGKNGILNFLGGGAVTDNIGAGVNLGISQLNVNTAGVTANTVAAGGNIYAESINLKNSGVLTLAAGKNIVGTTATTLTGAQQTITTDFAHTGTLTLEGGIQNVTGVVGANDATIAEVNAGVTGAVATFNNMVFSDTLAFSGHGTVILNGQAGVDVNTAGIKGTVDFGLNGSGELQIGDNVNLTTGTTGIQMTNAGDATLTFNGTSTVTGVVGGDTSGRSTLRTIQAGVTGKAVTFKNDVYVSEAAEPTTFHITEDGTVNFQGNLNGQLVFDNGADGTVNVSNTKSLIVTSAIPAAGSEAGGEGTINFLGGTTLSSALGEVGHELKAVNFNTATNNISQTINKDVFADAVTIGGTVGTTAISKVNVTGAYDYAGANSMFTFAGGTTAHLEGNLTLGGHLALANATTALNVGVAHVSTGSVTTAGGAMSFTVNSTDITTGGSASASTGSGQITATGALTMLGTEKVYVNYVGSLAQAGTYALITSVSGTAANLGNETGAKVSDNSFSIDTSVAQSSNGSLILTADRTAGATYAANQNYIQKAGTMGDYSNNAGMMLGGIAAAGSQTGDMVQVIQKLELDSFGFGNTAANLATQVKRLAPVANASLSQTSYATAGLSLNAVGVRMAALRGDTKLASSDAVTGLSAGDAVASNGFWVKALGSSNSQDKQGAYDGYSSKITGVTAGLDNRVNSDFVLGAALGLTKADINQADFRTGDTSRINNTQLMGYVTYSLTNELYLDGALSFARNDYTGIRATAVGRTASSAFNGNQLGARLGLGYGIDLGSKLKLTPMASVDYSRLTQDAYTETGAGAINLAVDAQSTHNTRLGLGARLSNEWTEGSTTYRPEVALNWSQNSNSISNDVNATFVGGGVGFVTPGTTAVSRNSVNLGVAMTVLSSKTTSIQIRYDLDKSTGFTANTGSLLARWEY